MRYLTSVLSSTGRNLTAILDSAALVASVENLELGQRQCITMKDIQGVIYHVQKVDSVRAEPIAEPKQINPPAEPTSTKKEVEKKKQDTINLTDKTDENSVS